MITQSRPVTVQCLGASSRVLRIPTPEYKRTTDYLCAGESARDTVTDPREAATQGAQAKASRAARTAHGTAAAPAPARAAARDRRRDRLRLRCYQLRGQSRKGHGGALRG